MNRLQIYGQDHSPWVQAVLLGLHEKKITYRLTTVPSISLLTGRGIMMPAVQFENKPWIWESADILYNLGFKKPVEDDSIALRLAWQGVVHRADDPYRFFRLASRISDPESNKCRLITKQLFRGSIVVYFFLLLGCVRLTGLIRDPENFVTQFKYWNDKLESIETEFFGGEYPNQCDLQLFGIIQCHCSIPSPVLRVLTDSPELARLRLWIEVMQIRFREFPHLYSGIYFCPNLPEPVHAGAIQRAAFWCGVLLVTVLFPITLPLMVFNAIRTHGWSNIRTKAI